MSHIYCPECGFQNLESANYCSRCGALLVTEGSRRHDADVLRSRSSQEAAQRRARGARNRGPGARRPLGRRTRRRARSRSSAPQTTIGRSPDCDIFLDDVTVSRRHAIVARGDSRVHDRGPRQPERNVPEPLTGSRRPISRTATRFRSASTASSSSPDDDHRTGTHDPPAAHDRRVCRRLQAEFPDISISKIRYLEDQGLLSPKRTRGGYRLFSEDDVDRLETILRLQRDEFLPLRVIRQELASPVGKERRRRRAGLTAAPPSIDLDELCERAGISAQQARELEEYGLLEAPFTEADADTAAVCARLSPPAPTPATCASSSPQPATRRTCSRRSSRSCARGTRRPARVRSRTCTGSPSSTQELSQLLFWRALRHRVAST